MKHHVKESNRIGTYEVQVVWDEHPSHPDEGNDEAFLVALDHRNFYVPRSGWSEHSDFRDFVNPQNGDNDHNELLSGPRPEEEPKVGDAAYRAVYLDHCENQLELLAAASGAEIAFSDPPARYEADCNYDARTEVWDSWQRYDAAHAEWACYSVDIRNYGGGCLGISLGGVYEGGERDRYGDLREPDGYILVKKDVGWHHPVEEVAKGVLESWRKYIDGEIVGYRVVKIDEDGEELEEIDACWGFDDPDYCMAEGMAIAEAMVAQDKAEEERERGMRHSHHHAEEAQGELGHS